MDRRPPADAAESEAAEAPGRLLVVDDLMINRMMLARWLARCGFEVVEAESGWRALELIETSRFDLVVLDIVMPAMSGLEVLRRIREIHAPDALPVFMASAKSEDAEISQALDLGADGYFIKPLDLPAVLVRIEATLADRRRGEAAKRKRA